MAYEEILQCISIPASADLSADQFKCVVNSTAGLAVAGAGVAVTGVLQDNPDTAGQAACVGVYGVSKLYATAGAGGAIAPGDAVESSTAGLAIVQSTGAVVGTAQEACPSGETKVISVLLKA